MSNESRAVIPLGVFGRLPADVFLKEHLLPLAGLLREDERPAIARYLSSAAIVFAIMECTTDIIGAFPPEKRKEIQYGVPLIESVGGKFAYSGGSGTSTDGTYFWRQDAAGYVEHYGIGLPEEFLRHGRSRGWVAPTMSPEEVLAVRRFLVERSRPSSPDPKS